MNATELPGLKHVFERRRRALYPGGPKVSIVGFGAMRIAGEQGSPERDDGAAALRHALGLGVNLIDSGGTSFDAQNEIVIGRVLKEAREAGVSDADGTVVVTRAGALRGRHLERFLSKEQRGVTGETFFLQNGDAVTFDAQNLRAQVSASAARLGRARIDAVLFDAPELYLRWCAERGGTPNEAQQELIDRMSEAFAGLQAMVDEGLIGCYGVSSEYLDYPPEHPFRITMDALLEAVLRGCGRPLAESGFRLVAFPLNWIELTGVQQPEGPRLALLDELKQEGIGALACRPLNALSRGRLIRLARPDLSDARLVGLTGPQKRGLENWAQLSLDLERMAHEVLEQVGYEDAPLSQLALGTVASLSEVSAVLVGMRRVSYVEDALEALGRPLLLRPRELLGLIHERLEFDSNPSV